MAHSGVRVGSVLLIVAFCGCGSSSSGLSAGDKILEQTTRDYDRDYSHTTCRQFEHGLTDGQRTAAAFGALDRLRSDDGLPAPSVAEVERFAAGIDGACEAIPSHGLVRAAVFIYQNGDY